jgi:hypothetical protein
LVRAHTNKNTQESNMSDDRMSRGVGAAERNTVDATRASEFTSDSPQSSQGETAGAGSIYSAQLNERPNLSNMRNQGPSRAPSSIGRSKIPVVSQGSRNTGRK